MADTDDILLALTKRRLGRVLGSFRLESVLGVGGVTAVYVGVRDDGAHAAVRVLHPEVAAIPEAAEMFLSGARGANRVGHAGAVRVLEWGDDPARPYLVTPLLEGPTVAERAASRGGRLRAADVVRVADAVLETLVYAHRHEVAHGDVQPHNLRLTPRGLRLLDFGLSPVRRLAAQHGVPAHTAVDASSAWLADRPTPTQDLGALGASMAALLTGGELPAPGARIDPIAEVDAGLTTLIRRAMKGEIPGAGAMRAELAELAARSLAAPSIMPSAPPSAATLSAPPASTRPSAPAPTSRPPSVSAPQPPSGARPPSPSRTPGAGPSTPTAPAISHPPVVSSSRPPGVSTSPPGAPPSRPASASPSRSSAPIPTEGLSLDLRQPPAPSLELDVEKVAVAAPSTAPRARSTAPPHISASIRIGTVDPTGRDVAAGRALFGLVARCSSGGPRAIVEALAYEATPAPPGAEAQAAREAARPEVGRWLLRALESMTAAIAASEGLFLVEVRPRGFELHGQPVWQPHGPAERVPARLAASGVRALGFRRGLMLPELGEVLRVFAAITDGDPRLDEDLAGVLWEAALPHVHVEADDDPLGPLDGDPGEDLLAEKAQELTTLRTWDARALTAAHRRWAGRGPELAPLHERLIDLLTQLPADVQRREEAEEIFGGRGATDIAIPRAEALHIEAETRRSMLLDLEVDPVVTIERCGPAAARAWELAGTPVAAALRGSIDELSRAEPLAALGLIHATCAALEVHRPDGAGGAPMFELAVDLGGGAPSGEPQDERRCALCRALASEELLVRILTATPAEGRAGRHGQTPAAVMATRVRELLARLDGDATPAALRAFPGVVVPEVRLELERTLTRAGGAVVEPIAALVPTLAVDPAVALLRVLAAIGTRQALDAIAAGAESPHPLVRIEALSHVEGASSERLREELDTLLEDPDLPVRLAALRTIAESRIKVAGPHLALLAKAESFDDRPLDERRAMLTALGALLPSRAEDICLAHVQKSPLIPRAAHEDTRELAAEVLGEISASPEIAQALLEVSERRWRNTERARNAARAAAERVAARRRGGASPTGGPR